MISSPPRASRKLVGTLYSYMFLSEFVLLYPVYTLLFTDAGLSVAETSSLFVIWSVTGMVLEVPSGAWADTVSRRLLLFLGPLLGAAGFGLWTLSPSYWAFALGFVLWGAKEALVSGSLEALVYEELERLGESGRYATVMGRARSVGLCADAAAIGLAVPVFAVGGYPVVGAASVVVGLGCAAMALAFREHRSDAEPEAGDGYLATLKAGLAEARGDRRVLKALLLVPVVTAVWGALEEYVPFLGLEAGVSESTVPLLILLVWVGATAGGLLAGRAQRLPVRGLAAVIAAAATAMAGGALTGHPAGFLLVAVAFGAFHMAEVVADARLQDRITGAGRATVTSVAGLGTNVVGLLVYAVYGLTSSFVSHGVSFALLVVPYVLVALWLASGSGQGR
ncbi:MFS transporter [Nonomuraea sp. NPDC005983]|uniref:MFS transporter n=1 Tax=Nonomuraea sp. NPDC005983 TaxID=3155595 RepID=UPI0033AF3D0D